MGGAAVSLVTARIPEYKPGDLQDGDIVSLGDSSMRWIVSEPEPGVFAFTLIGERVQIPKQKYKAHFVSMQMDPALWRRLRHGR